MTERLELPPLPAEPTVSVVVPARNAASTLPACIDSAVTQDPAPHEVVIAVGPSTDRTREVADELARRCPSVRVVENRDGTTSAALNTAIAASSGQVVARLDAHAELTRGYLGRAVALLRETGAANVGGRQVPVAEEGFARAVALAMVSRTGAGGATYRVGGTPGDVDTVYLGVFRREALAAVGGFDEELLRNQDYVLNHRLRRAGCRVYFHPELAVVYRPRATVVGLARQYYQYGAWKRFVLRRHPTSTRLRQVVPPAFVVGLVATAALGPFVSWWPFGAVVLAYSGFVGAGAWRAASAADTPRDTLPTMLALSVMHLSWGVGFLVGRAAGPRRAG